ncbi:MAG: carbohydrate ABC transporter permease [Spirochaetaceae bacterium]|jgi:multiple sugar transport system permease protein|nr:carbohydrate ABC transporter permease [Spirochaetaceae bacterium]
MPRITATISATGTARRLPDYLAVAALVAGAAFVLLPLVFMVTASFMPALEITHMPYRWLPSRVEWSNFYRAIAGNDGNFVFIRNVMNSLFVAVVVSFTTVMLSSLTGYGLSKFRFKARNIVFMAIMMTMMIPFETIMVPLYMVALNLRLQNSYAGLIVPFMMNAFGVFMMRQYLQTFPTDILDAARIDGTTEPGIFLKIVMVNSGPALASLAILSFRQQWDNLLWPLMVAQDKRLKTIPTYIVSFAEEKFADEGAMMAVAFLASIPVIIMFITLSRYFVGGSAVYSAGKE